jgi:hypothetical protein
VKSNFAVLGYPNSNNLGDFIQSIAAEEWMKPKIPQRIDRDQLHKYQGPPVKLVMNGWFMEEPTNWPPSESIQPLFISFHLNPTAERGMLNSEGIQYFKKHQPIGCRDTYTQKTLEKHGIQTYFSACLTLTLKRANSFKSDKKRKGILVLSPLERLLPQEEINKQQGLKGQLLSIAQKLKQPFKSNKYSVAMNRLEAYLSQMDEEVLVKTQLMSPSTFSESDRIKAAQEQLECIASAKLVITSRIHSALPAVAYGTPVIFLADGLQHPNQKSRFEGMESFFKMITSEQLKTLEKNIPVPKKVPEVLLKRFEKELNTFLKD